MPNGSNSAAMKGSGRIKRGQHSQSIVRDPPEQTTYSRLTCSAANALEYWEPAQISGRKRNRTDSAAGKVKMRTSA